MNTYDLVNQSEHEVMSKPLPLNINEMPYLQKLKYVATIKAKRDILERRQESESTTLSDNEIVILTPGLQMEFFRCTSLKAMQKFIHTTNPPILEVYLTGEVNTIVVRVGQAMQNLLNESNVKLKIVDIYGEEILIETIQPDIISNRKY